MVAVFIAVFGFYLLVAQQKVLYKNYVKYPVVSFNAFFRTLGDYTKIAASTRDKTRETVEIVPTAHRPTNNIIFVIDESVRGDHLSLNGYFRKTTPYLESLAGKGMLQNWGIATSVTTCSESSALFLATGLKIQDLPDLKDKAHEAPTIFQYAKAMGYRTYYLDGQMNVLWNLKPADMKYVDEWWNFSRFLEISNNREKVDFAIAETTKNIVETSTGNFIWVIKSGMHFPYYKRFPENEAEWTPFFASDRGGEQVPDQLTNSYDNAIKYNLDGFFKSLIPDFRLAANTVVLYTSDHGETVGQDGNPNFHCGVTKLEVVVPLFMIGYAQTNLDTKFRASHENLFATLLDLMQVPQSARRREHARSLLQARERDTVPRFYVGPGLLSQDKFQFE
ncbi:MAG: sulfatase-like hydrolase/transferase [Acidobacteria bacterium]|nr:sulfatase-like hydrolase/transferase [Acidobacteriota bacterium]